MKNKLTRSRPPKSACNNLVHLSFLSGCLNTIPKINLGRPSALVTVTCSAAAAASPCWPPAMSTLSGAKDVSCERGRRAKRKRLTIIWKVYHKQQLAEKNDQFDPILDVVNYSDCFLLLLHRLFCSENSWKLIIHLSIHHFLTTRPLAQISLSF